MITLADALAQGRKRIANVSRSASLDAQLLMAKVLGVDRVYVLAHGERELSEAELARFIVLVERAAKGEPLAYILGKRAFYKGEFIVTPDVLIPRPETELLVEKALAWINEQCDRPFRAIDIGTGSGAIAVSVAMDAPASVEVHASEVSLPALEIAKQNATLHGVADRMTFWHGDLLTPVIEHGLKFDLIMANLPYIPHEVIDGLDVKVRDFEPDVALDGGGDGLDLVRRLIAQIPSVCDKGACILLEIGADQGAAALETVQTLHPTFATVHKDYAGLDRTVEARL